VNTTTQQQLYHLTSCQAAIFQGGSFYVRTENHAHHLVRYTLYQYQSSLLASEHHYAAATVSLDIVSATLKKLLIEKHQIYFYLCLYNAVTLLTNMQFTYGLINDAHIPMTCAKFTPTYLLDTFPFLCSGNFRGSAK